MKTLCLIMLFCLIWSQCFSQISWCGERVPVERTYVRDKLIAALKKNYNSIVRSDIQKRIYYYFPYLQQTISKYDLPEDLVFLTLVESKLTTHSTSSAGAQGMWQIMPAFAKDFNLSIAGGSYGTDERNSVVKSTHAVCRWWVKYYGFVNNWTLQTAGYNWGIGNVQKAIKKYGTRDYWKMPLNKETAAYLYEAVSFKILYEQLLSNKLNSFFSDKNNLYAALKNITTDEIQLAKEDNNENNEVVIESKTTAVVEETKSEGKWRRSGWGQKNRIIASNEKDSNTVDTPKNTETVYVTASFIQLDFVEDNGQVTFRLLEDVSINGVILEKDKLIPGLIYNSKKADRVFVTIAGVDIDKRLMDYDVQIADIGMNPGIQVGRNSRNKILIPDGYKVKLKFSNI